jgi:hypothetical protein
MLKKVLLLLTIAIVASVLWFSGMETLYARALVFSTNVVLDMGGRETRLSIEKEKNIYKFRVHTRIEGRKASYIQKFGALLIPTVMLLTWQLFSAFYLKKKKALQSSIFNLGILLLLQMVFLLFLTIYHTSSVAKYLYDMMMDSFYIFALFLIIVDNFRNPIFLVQTKQM